MTSSDQHKLVVSAIKSLAKVTDGLSPSDADELTRYAVALATFLNSKCKYLLHSTQGQPVMLQFGSDCAPIRVRATQSQRLGEHQISLKALKLLELYVQQVFLTTYDSSGARQHGLALREPIALKHGKTMGALLACTLERFPGIELLNSCAGRIQINHQIMDRGMTAEYRHALSGFWAEACQNSVQSADQPLNSELFQWHSSLGCACHDCHNALKWATSVLFAEDSDLLKHIYVAISVWKPCALNTSQALGPWLAQVLQGRPEYEGQAAELHVFYTLLGADADLALFLSETAGLFWDLATRQLCCKPSFLATDDCLTVLSIRLMQCWHFDSFTASRWCTLGTACRQIALAASVGFASLFRHMCQSGALSSFESGHHFQLSEDGHHFAVVVGLIAYVPDSVLSFTMSENRLAMCPDDVYSCSSIEHQYLEEVPRHAWLRLGRLVQRRATGL